MRLVATQFAALLYQQTFAPLAQTMGFFGDAVVASVAQSLAQHERSGLAGRLEHLFEAVRR